MEMTLNMLRPSNLRPAISAYAYVFGTHDYIRVPLAPLGCKTQCFVGPDNQTSYGEDSVDLWYIGTSTKCYRSSKVLVKETGAERMTDTLVFMHRHTTNPTVTSRLYFCCSEKVHGSYKRQSGQRNFQTGYERVGEIG
jgi:hypothetical protein